MLWWTWFLLGLLLLVAELFIPTGFVLLLFGFAAILTALLTKLGLVTSLVGQVVVCCAAACALLVAMRGRLPGRVQGARGELGPLMAAEIVTINSKLAPGEEGKGEFRGGHWSVKNLGTSTLLAGKRYPVSRMDGFTLIVDKEE